MAKFKNELSDYQVISRELIFDDTLSDRARFVYCFMAAKPDGWAFFLEPMAKEIGYSVDTLRKYINELSISGWLIKGEQQFGEKGHFGAVEYTLKATKITDSENFRHGKNLTQDNKDNKEKRDSKEENKKNAEIEDFVNRIYAMYPSKCPVRNTPLGKSGKDKDRIRKLLKTYSKEDIEKVVKHEVEEKYGKHMMQNFSTFLNNFPDPESLFGGNISGTVAYPHSIDDVKTEDINYSWSFYVYWAEKSGAYKLYDKMKCGFPENDQQYQHLLEHTIGGAKTFAYVILVFMRDGWKDYDDERGFMWIYSNYIKANGLYKE